MKIYSAPSLTRFVLSVTLSSLLALPAHACNDDEDDYQLPPFNACDHWFDGNCHWRQCGSDGVENTGCNTNPYDPPPAPPSPPDPTPPDNTEPPPDLCPEANSFTARDGNARRQIVDLRIAGALASGGLLWTRHHNTVPREGKEYFGFSGGWRHNWQYDLIEKNQPGATRPAYTFITPEGTRRFFAPDSMAGWSSALSSAEILQKTSDGFDVISSANVKYHFVSYKTPKGYTQYRMEAVTDPHGLKTRLTYNAQGLLTKVIEPAGRFLTLEYEDVPYDTGRFDLQVGTIPTAPASGQWIELALPANLQGKLFQDFCLFGEKDGKLSVAEMQFFAAGSSTPLRGTASGTGYHLERAFDGDTNTGFEGNREVDNLLALRLDVPAIVDRVRILPVAGSEDSLRGAWLQAYRTASEVRTVLSTVTGSDGSSVSYDYEATLYAWKIGPASKTVELKAARYADGSKASYRYEVGSADRKPLLVEADDPRYVGKAKRIRYNYHESRLGMLHKEINPETGGTYAVLEIDPKNPSKRLVKYSDFRQISFVISSKDRGRPVERKDSLGRITRYEYSENGAGQLSAEIDHSGHRKEFKRDTRGRIISSKVRGKNRLQVRDIAGRALKTVDHFGRETAFSHDSNGRISRITYPDRSTQELSYDQLGRQTAFRDVDGRTHAFTYDSRGLKRTWKNPEGQVTSYSYDTRDRLASVTNPLGQKISYEYNDQGLVTKIVRPDGTNEQFGYDNYGRKTSQTDPLGRTNHFSYDQLSRVVMQTDKRGGVTRYDYTELPNGCGSCTLIPKPSAIFHPDGRVTRNLYDAAGRLIAETRHAGTAAEATTTYTYDNDDNLVTVSDPLGRITRHTYDADGHRISTTDALGHTTLFAYDDHGNLLSVSTVNGAITRHKYDAKDRRISTTDPLGNVTGFTYDVLGNIVTTTDATGAVTRFIYEGKKHTAIVHSDGKRQQWEFDSLGRVSKATNTEGVVSISTYDALGRMLASTQTTPGKVAQTISFTYDALGRRTSSTDALGLTTRWTYDAAGNVLGTTRPDGVSLHNTYDAKNRPLTSTDAAGHTTRYEYDSADNLTALVDAKGSTYRFTYDGARRKTAMIYPDGSREKWAYNVGGQLITFTNRSGQTKTIAYNLGGQPISETWSPRGAATDLTYSYDSTGRLLTLENATANLSYAYDVLGRLVSETSDLRKLLPGLAPHTVSYAFDKLGRPLSLTYPDNAKARYTYDLRNRLTSVDDDGRGQPLAAYSYDALGRINQVTRDNGVSTRYMYDMAGQLTDLVHAKGSQTLASARYTLDNLGRRTAQTREDNITENYRYDATSQLTGVDYGLAARGTETFSYDAVGNRTEAGRVIPDAPATLINYQANYLNQYTSVAGTTFAYDTNGNLVNDGRQTYRYDAQNRLLTVESIGHSIPVRAEFFYDARNRCVLRKFFTRGATGLWVINPDDSRALTYDTAWNLLAERKLNGADAGKYIHGQRTDEILAATIYGQAVYPLAEGLGSTVALVNKNGKVTQRFRYDAYGQAQALTAGYQASSNTFSYRFLYTGREWFNSINLQEHRNRYYSPGLGRWLTDAPLRLGGGDTNLKRYVQNSPQTYTDSYGLTADCPKKEPCAEISQYLQGLLAKIKILQQYSAQLGADSAALIEAGYSVNLATARAFSLGLLDFAPSIGADGDVLLKFPAGATADAIQIYNSNGPVDLTLNTASAVGGYAQLLTEVIEHGAIGGSTPSSASLNLAVSRVNLILAIASFTLDVYGAIEDTDEFYHLQRENIINTLKNDNDLTSLYGKFDDGLEGYNNCIERAYQ